MYNKSDVMLTEEKLKRFISKKQQTARQLTECKITVM
jgi:hypothetical protein